MTGDTPEKYIPTPEELKGDSPSYCYGDCSVPRGFLTNTVINTSQVLNKPITWVEYDEDEDGAL